jgi:hypothetical protein
MTLVLDDRIGYVPPYASGVLGPRRTAIGELACATPLADAMALIPQSQWKGQIAAITEAKRWPQDTWDRLKLPHDSQDGLNYCWAWALKRCVQHDFLQRFGVFVDLAPESLGGSVSWRNAGNYLDDAILWASEHGIARREFVPMHQIDPRRFKGDWEADALQIRPVEWWELGKRDMLAEVVTALLCGFTVYAGYRWWSHAIALTRLVTLDDGRMGIYSPNSHGDEGVILAGSRMVPDLGCFCVRATTRPRYLDDYPVLSV